MQNMQLLKRDPLKDGAYFNRQIPYIEGRVADWEQQFADQRGGISEPDCDLAYRLFINRCELLLMRYSAGHEMRTLAIWVPALVRAWVKFKNLEQRAMKGRHWVGQRQRTGINPYMENLWMICLGILFRVDDQMFRRLIRFTIRDAFMDRLIATRIPGRPEKNKLLFADCFQPLYEATLTSGARQTAFIEYYLTHWYGNMAVLQVIAQNPGFMGWYTIELKLSMQRFQERGYLPEILKGFVNQGLIEESQTDAGTYRVTDQGVRLAAELQKRMHP